MRRTHLMAVAAAFPLAVEFAVFCWRVNRAYGMADRAVAYQRDCHPARLRVLVAGDSSAVGTGAERPEDSVAGRLAAACPDLAIANVARNGMRTHEVAGVLRAFGEQAFDLVLLHTGANDIIRLTPMDELEQHIGQALAEDSRVGCRVVLLTGGNVGMLPLCPLALRWYYARRTRQVRELFRTAAAAHGACYVDLFFTAWSEMWAGRHTDLVAKDGLHPSSTGYGVWYERIRQALDDAGLSIAA